jgi:Ser/Thr protein kinase RdoA (MazF antagonist)
VHGDFTMNNVGWDEAGDTLVVVDWSTTPMIDPMATIASPYYDVHWFVFHLFYGIPLRGRIMPDSRGAADAFLDGYASRRDFSEASFERLRGAQADHYEREIVDSTAMRSALTKLPYSAVQRARYRRWASYRPPARG